MMTSREQFEEIFRKAYPDIPQSHKNTMLEWYNHGTDDEPEWGYYSLLARQAFEWWELSREAVEVQLPSLKQIDSDERYVWSDGVFNFKEDVIESIRAAGIKIIEGEQKNG